MTQIVTATNAPTLDVGEAEASRLVELAKAEAEADSKLTIRQALRKYKKAVFWSLFLSTSLIMEGFDLAICGQVLGLIVNGFCQDYFGCRKTFMFFMVWMVLAIFIPFFSTTPELLAAGEALCGIPWGVFQTLSTTYACEIVPTVLRPYVTAYVCMCWGAGNVIASVAVRACSVLTNQWAWRIPYGLQWIWPVPLFIGGYFAPESPWNSIRRGRYEEARKNLARLRAPDTTQEEIDATVAYIDHTTRLEKAETSGATFIACFQGTNLRRTEINCVTWMAQILCGNALLNYAVVFLQNAGWSQDQTFNINIALRSCYVIGGIISWFLMVRVGRADLYIGGLAFMFACLIAIGGLGFAHSNSATLAVGIVLVIQTLCNMITVGPVCYPLVSETPSGRLRYKTIVIGRFVYQLTQIFNNSVTPRMVSSTSWNWGAKAGFFYAGTNLLCLVWCILRLPETKDRSFGEIDLLFENKVPARKFKHTKVDRQCHFVLFRNPYAE
ncbi:hypothetical protein JCM24511_05331 [Saitozyma sp. JCM 24511]|nr:hypothetical protein JCM24511_05331 [Saitozyma sp. JCM 24511]